jgi:hypothetical protein
MTFVLNERRTVLFSLINVFSQHVCQIVQTLFNIFVCDYLIHISFQIPRAQNCRQGCQPKTPIYQNSYTDTKTIYSSSISTKSIMCLKDVPTVRSPLSIHSTHCRLLEITQRCHQDLGNAEHATGYPSVRPCSYCLLQESPCTFGLKTHPFVMANVT